ncbi:putative leader peptide [Streptomyces mirabilis]|uniref:putative leader peptide n=2 Tax=Streptomyces TaxID=1883 RepID=UPI00359C5004
MPPRPTPARSGSTSRSVSPCAAARTSSSSELRAPSRNRRPRRAVVLKRFTMSARPQARRDARAEVRDVRVGSDLRVMVLTPRRRVRLYSRPHIDLQRVAGALCRP